MINDIGHAFEDVLGCVVWERSNRVAHNVVPAPQDLLFCIKKQAGTKPTKQAIVVAEFLLLVVVVGVVGGI